MGIADYHATAGDWRAQLRRNEKKTRSVIVVFFLVYILVGLIVDAFVLQGMYPHASLEKIIYALITFKVVPIATLLMIAFAGISLLITYALYDRIMLLGTEYYEITPETAPYKKNNYTTLLKR